MRVEGYSERGICLVRIKDTFLWIGESADSKDSLYNKSEVKFPEMYHGDSFELYEKEGEIGIAWENSSNYFNWNCEVYFPLEMVSEYGYSYAFNTGFAIFDENRKFLYKNGGRGENFFPESAYLDLKQDEVVKSDDWVDWLVSTMGASNLIPTLAMWSFTLIILAKCIELMLTTTSL